ncbi:MAG: hypothetical protein HQK55_00965 [Deltaproteobacteria bacterium]|nr:hypothetical protein [Deltaproteobacteria bacterium]
MIRKSIVLLRAGDEAIIRHKNGLGYGFEFREMAGHTALLGNQIGSDVTNAMHFEPRPKASVAEVGNSWNAS